MINTEDSLTEELEKFLKMLKQFHQSPSDVSCIATVGLVSMNATFGESHGQINHAKCL